MIYHLGTLIRVILLALHSCISTNLENLPSDEFSLDTFLMDPCRKAHFSTVQTTAYAIGRAGLRPRSVEWTARVGAT